MKNLYSRLEYGWANIKQVKHKNPLVGRITSDKTPLFHLDHLQLKESHPSINDGVDLEESVLALKECRNIMDQLLNQKWSESIYQRLLEDPGFKAGRYDVRYLERSGLLTGGEGSWPK